MGQNWIKNEYGAGEKSRCSEENAIAKKKSTEITKKEYKRVLTEKVMAVECAPLLTGTEVAFAEVRKENFWCAFRLRRGLKKRVKTFLTGCGKRV